MIRLNKLLAERGIGARRKCDEIISSGAVKVNGHVVTEPGTQVEPERDRVEVDGRPLPGPAAKRMYMLHKPVGVISTLSDPEGRRSLRELMPSGIRLFPIGRLDADTSGLLLLTNDGELAHHLMHPRYGVPKRYRAHVDRAPSEEMLERLKNGIEFEPGVVSAPAQVWLRDSDGGEAVVELALHEGRHRQVRLMCEAAGLEVKRLHRWGYGPLRLGELARGMYRELSEDEVEALRSASARPARREGFTGRRSFDRPSAPRGARRTRDEYVRAPEHSGGETTEAPRRPSFADRLRRPETRVWRSDRPAREDRGAPPRDRGPRDAGARGPRRDALNRGERFERRQGGGARGGGARGFERRPPAAGGAERRPRREGSFERRPRPEGSFERRPRSEGSYERRPRPEGGFERGSRSGGSFERRPRGEGSSERRPRPQGSFERRPRSEGSFERRPRSEGSYERRPRPEGGFERGPRSGGSFERRPPRPEGSFERRPRSGGSFERRPPGGGGFERGGGRGVPRGPRAGGSSERAGGRGGERGFVRDREERPRRGFGGGTGGESRGFERRPRAGGGDRAPRGPARGGRPFDRDRPARGSFSPRRGPGGPPGRERPARGSFGGPRGDDRGPARSRGDRPRGPGSGSRGPARASERGGFPPARAPGSPGARGPRGRGGPRAVGRGGPRGPKKPRGRASKS